MTSKKRILNVFSFKSTDRLPVSPHWWGMYKFQLSKIANDFTEEHLTWHYNGQRLADVDDLFYNTYKPDMLHLSGGCSNEQYDQAFFDEREQLIKAVQQFDSFAAIDELVSFTCRTSEQTIKSGIYDHVAIHAKNHPDVFIALNEGNPIGSIIDAHGFAGFEPGLMAMIEKPKFMERLIFSFYEKYLDQVKVLKAMGADGYIGSETMCSADLINPDLWRNLILPAQRYFYTELKRIGLIGIAYFTGEITPYLNDIPSMNATAIMVEENKKNYTLDIGVITKSLYEKVAVFGNIDSIYDVLLGTPEQVKKAVISQIDSLPAKTGFVVSCGSPLAFNTPKENISAIKEAVCEYFGVD